MKNIIYILLFIWNTGIGQSDELTDLKIALGGTANNVGGIDTTNLIFSGSLYLNDSALTTRINGISDTNTIIEYRGFERHEFNTFKYDTVKAVLMVSDSADEVITNVFRNGEEIKIGGIRYSDTYFYWLYGYVIIQSEFCMISCPDGMPGCLVAHYGYGNKKEIGYLDSSKQPFSKDIIIWDYKIVE